jgi:hypothetical protein
VAGLYRWLSFSQASCHYFVYLFRFDPKRSRGAYALAAIHDVIMFAHAAP